MNSTLALIIRRRWLLISNMPEDSPQLPSPCVSVCTLSEQGFCLGCCRHQSEIANWSALDGRAQREVWARVVERIDQLSLETPSSSCISTNN